MALADTHTAPTQHEDCICQTWSGKPDLQLELSSHHGSQTLVAGQASLPNKLKQALLEVPWSLPLHQAGIIDI